MEDLVSSIKDQIQVIVKIYGRHYDELSDTERHQIIQLEKCLKLLNEEDLSDEFIRELSSSINNPIQDKKSKIKCG